jgi:hypothetical protein
MLEMPTQRANTHLITALCAVRGGHSWVPPVRNGPSEACCGCSGLCHKVGRGKGFGYNHLEEYREVCMVLDSLPVRNSACISVRQ